MAYDPFHTLELHAPERIAIFRWDPDQEQTSNPVVAGVPPEEARKSLLDFFVTKKCQSPPQGWERVVYRGPYQKAPAGIYELPRDFLDVTAQGIKTISSGTTVDEVKRALSRSISLLVGRVVQEASPV